MVAPAYCAALLSARFFDGVLVSYWPLAESAVQILQASKDLCARQRTAGHVIFIYKLMHRCGCQGWRLPKYVDHGAAGGCPNEPGRLRTMYVGPWQEYRALARARHAEALYATRGPETQVADELERLRRALELVSGELPADKAAKVREALAPVAEPGPPPLPGLSWNPRAAPRRPAPVVRPVKPPPHVLTSLRLDDVRGGAATFLLGTRAPSTDASTAGKNASAHSAQALGLADFKNAFSTPLSSRGGPAARPLSARSARSQASSEHRTSRSDDRRPREGHATARPPARVARRRRLGSDAAKDVARVQGCRRAPAKTVRAGTAAATGAAADARGAIDVRSRQNRAVPTSGAPWATDPSCLPYVVRGAVRVRARARAAGDRRGATAAANGDAGRARARPGRVHAPGVPRGRSPR